MCIRDRYDTLSDVAASINKAMGEISVGDGKTLDVYKRQGDDL